MTQDYTLKNVMEVPENFLTEEMLDFSGLTREETLEKWRVNVKYSIKEREEFILQVQKNNKQKRLLIMKRCKDNVKYQEFYMKKCRDNPLLFFTLFLWTYNPRLDKPHLPFIPYPFQDDFIASIVSSINRGEDVFVEKTRDVGFSWQMIGIYTRGWLFHGWSTLSGSYKEDYVDEQGNMDSNFERYRYVLSRLPEWMIPDDLASKYMSVSSKMYGDKEISGDSGPNFGTGGRRKSVWLDEFALWTRDATAFRKTKDVTDCRIFGGTPEGTNNVYGKVMTNHKDYKHYLCKKIRLHWRDHPLKTQAWYDMQKATRTTLDLAKEIDISYETSVSGAVYPLFTKMATKGTFVYDIKRKTYGSWDFGRDSNAFILWQKDFRTGNLYVIKTFERVGWHIKDFAGLVIGKAYQGNNWAYTTEDYELMEYMQMIRFSNHFGDPYNADSKTTAQTQSIRDALRDMGIDMVTNRNSILKERINKTKLMLNRVFYDSECHEWEQAIIQSHYPQIKEGSESTSEKDKPVHDENSHYRTATEYMADNEPDHNIGHDDEGVNVKTIANRR